METLFVCDIYDWKSWGGVFQSIPAWEKLIQHIYKKHGLPYAAAEHLAVGTNAVFKVGNTVVKLFAPVESGAYARSDYETELFGLKRANTLGILAPKLLACGCVFDKYDFLYMVMEHAQGASLAKLDGALTDAQKEAIGVRLRGILLRMNAPCEPFNEIDVVKRAISAKGWDAFPARFQQERLAWLARYRANGLVYAHGDLNPDNILVEEGGGITIIDFADGVLAPPAYELPALVCCSFEFEGPYMRGLFGPDYSAGDIAEKCFGAILMHDFGQDIIADNFGEPADITSLSELKNRVHAAAEAGKHM